MKGDLLYYADVIKRSVRHLLTKGEGVKKKAKHVLM